MSDKITHAEEDCLEQGCPECLPPENTGPDSPEDHIPLVVLDNPTDNT